MRVTATERCRLFLAAGAALFSFGCVGGSTIGGQCGTGSVQGADGQCVKVCAEDADCPRDFYCSGLEFEIDTSAVKARAGECVIGSRPQVGGHFPLQDEMGVALDVAISLTFSLAMDRGRAERAFSLMCDDHVVAGTYAWDRGSRVLTFTPDRLLNPSNTCRVILTSGAYSAQGVPLGTRFWFSFQT